MKIVCCIESFLPGHRGGGPVRALDNLIQQLGKAHTFRVFTRNHDYLESEIYTDVQSKVWIPRPHYSIFYASDFQIKKQIVREISADPPDWLYLQGALAPLTRTFLQLREKFPALATIPLLLAPHGNLSPAALQYHRLRKWAWMTYAKKMKLYSNIHWHAASEREADQIKKQFGSGVSIRTIPMAPTTKNGFADKKAINERIKNSKSDELRLVYFGRLAPEKNLPFAFEILKQFCTKYPSQSIVYDLIGPCEIKYLEKLRSLSMNLPKNGQVNYIGHMSTGVLREHLGGTNTAAPNLFFYHALLMPSFTENFSYTVLESLQAGIPALISDQTPWRDLEAVGAGWDLPLDVPKLWLDALKRLSDDSLQATVSRSEEALRYSSSYTEDYSNLGSRLFAPNQKV